jgi:transcriptional regulator
LYIPSAFSVTDEAKLIELMQAHSFATLVSSVDGHPVATHLPLLAERDAGGALRLTGHMARANPQWQTAADAETLAIFQGPHAYISAAWYGEQNVVPTWNYVTAHVYGTLRIVEDADQAMQILSRTVAEYEANRSDAWSMDSAEPEFIERLLQAIVAFHIDITGIEGCWKLNQHHSETRRQGAIAGLQQQGSPASLQVAELMRAAADD